MQAVAVGALHEHQVGGREGEGIVQDGRVVLAEIAREHQLAARLTARRAVSIRLLDPHLDAGRAEDVPGLAHAHRDAGQRVEGRVVGDGAHLAHHGVHVRGFEQRGHALVVPRDAAVGALGLADRELGGVAQQDGQQVGARRVRVDRTAETARHQQWQTAAMVDVRVAQHDRIDAAGCEREGAPVAGRGIRAALDHAAIEQQLAAAGPHDVAGPGHFARGTEKLQLHDRVIP
jgi:hypothetical protein